jgi:hypothetical protein
MLRVTLPSLRVLRGVWHDLWVHKGDKAADWEETPLYHPARWIGFKVRRWTWESDNEHHPHFGDPYHDGKWQYATRRQHARMILEEMCAKPRFNSGGYGRIK